MSRKYGNDDKLGDYAVGYGKPPKEHQFKPGQSGNRKGRPRKKKGRAQFIEDVQNKKVTVRIDGKEQQVTYWHAFAMQTYDQMLKGTIRDKEKGLQMLQKHFPQALANDDATSEIRIRFVQSDGNGRMAEFESMEEMEAANAAKLASATKEQGRADSATPDAANDKGNGVDEDDDAFLN